MKSLISVIVLSGCLWNLTWTASARKEEVETASKLLRDILHFDGYDSNIRPGEGKANSTVNVEFGASLVKIINLNVEEETLNAVFYFTLTWKDYRLAWDPKDYDGINVIRTRPYRIWRPDLTIFNGYDEHQGATQLYAHVNLLINSDGTIYYIPPVATKTACTIDRTSDLQSCKLQIGSWTYDAYQIDLTPSSDKVSVSDYAPNSKWSLEKADLKRNVKFYPCCDEPYVDVTITLDIRSRN